MPPRVEPEHEPDPERQELDPKRFQRGRRADYPEKSDHEPVSLRKLRWKTKGGGKRGGVRLIYYRHEKDDVIYMLLVYAKTVRDDLTRQQLKILRSLVKKELK